MGGIKYFYRIFKKLFLFAVERVTKKNKPTRYRRRTNYYDDMQFVTPRHATLESVSREIYRRNIQGNVAEAGVFQGGFAKYINVMFPDRKLYLIDTFKGFDEQDVKTEKEKGYSDGDEDFSKTSIEMVLTRMAYRENCIVKRGFFPNSMSDVEDIFCFVSLDMDLYEPTLNGLRWFWPRLQNGGVIFIHDCRNAAYKGCRQAVDEFSDEVGISFIILPDGEGSAVFVKK